MSIIFLVFISMLVYLLMVHNKYNDCKKKHHTFSSVRTALGVSIYQKLSERTEKMSDFVSLSRPSKSINNVKVRWCVDNLPAFFCT